MGKEVRRTIDLDARSEENLKRLAEHYQAQRPWVVGWAVRCLQAALQGGEPIPRPPRGQNAVHYSLRMAQETDELIETLARTTGLRKKARVIKAALALTCQKLEEQNWEVRP